MHSLETLSKALGRLVTCALKSKPQSLLQILKATELAVKEAHPKKRLSRELFCVVEAALDFLEEE